MSSFSELGLKQELLEGVERLGFTTPTKVQELAIPTILDSSQDLIALAQTGTGKTGAFGLPLLQKIDPEVNDVQAIVLSPTRELAIQIAKDLKAFAKKNDLWLHLDGHKSGHMFVKGDREPRMDELSVLGSALVDYSGLKIADIPLLFTQVKNLKGVKGVAGMVNYKKEKHLLVIYDAQWRQKVTAIDDGSEGWDNNK